ncbi:hypothetical protein SAMN05444173_3331 [Opitutus sp. GAS368]|nr:hypothetical protein SAMN05444173_3331 [Opitutus sp. GAS368]
MHHRRSSLPFFAFFALFVANLSADPLTKQLEIDFGRDVASRNLKGLATRSDGRVLPGPVFTDLAGPKLGEILWVMKPVAANKFLVGTGPAGKVQEVSFNAKDGSYTAREVADVPETNALALLPRPDGSLLIGTSPTAALYLFKDDKATARVPLPADSVFDFLPLPDGTVLAATGNPGKIYRLDLKKLAAAGLIEGKAGDDKLLADKGVTLFGEIRDRNVRKLARLADGRIIAGSSPKGNIYSFGTAGGPPLILQENRDAEVVDLLPLDEGGFYAALVFTTETASRLNRPVPVDPKGAETKDKPPVAVVEEKPGFTGRSSIVLFPTDGFPETVMTKPNIALYRLARHNGWLLLTAGELGDAFGYDPVSRRALTFAGSASSQLNDLAPLGDGRFLLLRNNAPGLALLSFAAAPVRELETKRLDLGVAADLGAFRFARLRGVEPVALKVEVRTNFGSDELEGWTPWTELKAHDGAFAAEGLRGRYVKFRLQVTGAPTDFQLDKATLYHLPQNRRPLLTDFRILPPNLGLIPAGDRPASASATLGQLLSPGPRGDRDDNEKRRDALLGSQVVPSPGTQIVYWAVTDPDGDNLTQTFSIRPENADTWTDLAVNTTDSYVQFETGGLAEGLYLTRLTVSEQAPRPAAQRLSYTFETDNLLVDRTPPVLSAPIITRANGLLKISITGRDALSLLEGAEFVLNNGDHETVVHPADGILDGREETFVAEIPEAVAAGATSVEITVYDRPGNAASIRVPLK